MIAVLAEFQPEIDKLQSEIEAMRGLIARSQERIEEIRNLTSVTGNAIAVLKSALHHISDLAPNAIAMLKSRVLSLFEDKVQQIEPDTCGRDTTIPIDTRICASELASLLEDAPESARRGQRFELACLIGSKDSKDSVPTLHSEPKQFVKLIEVNSHVSYLTKYDGKLLNVYVGFKNRTRARLWGEWLSTNCKIASGFEVRTAKRLVNYKHELTLYGISLDQIEQLALYDFSEDPIAQIANPDKNSTTALAQKIQSEETAIIDTEDLGEVELEKKTQPSTTQATRDATRDDSNRAESFSCRHIPGIVADTKSTPAFTQVDTERKDTTVPVNTRIDPTERLTEPLSSYSGIGVGDIVRSLHVKQWQFVVVGVNSKEFLVCDRLKADPPIQQVLHVSAIELVTRASVCIADQPEEEKMTHETPAIDSFDAPPDPDLTYSLLESSNLDQKWSVSVLHKSGKYRFIGSVSCGTNTSRWSHSRQPKYGQNIPYFKSKEEAAAALAKLKPNDLMPREQATAF